MAAQVALSTGKFVRQNSLYYRLQYAKNKHITVRIQVIIITKIFMENVGKYERMCSKSQPSDYKKKYSYVKHARNW